AGGEREVGATLGSCGDATQVRFPFTIAGGILERVGKELHIVDSRCAIQESGDDSIRAIEEDRSQDGKVLEVVGSDVAPGIVRSHSIVAEIDAKPYVPMDAVRTDQVAD